MWQPLPSSSGTVRCECGPLSQAASRAVAVSELTASQGRKRPLPGTVPRGPPHISQGLPQPLAAPGAGLFLEWAVGSGSWREGGCCTDLASSLSPTPRHTHLPGGKTEAQVERGGVAQAVVAGEWRAMTPQGHGQRSCPGEAHRVAHPLSLASTHAPLEAPSCPCFLSDK